MLANQFTYGRLQVAVKGGARVGVALLRNVSYVGVIAEQ